MQLGAWNANDSKKGNITLSLLEISNLTVVYPTRTGKFTAVQDVNLSVQPGEILGIVGESGAGKSTISAAIMQLIDYPGYIEKGSIKLSNINLIGMSEDEIYRLRGQKIGAEDGDDKRQTNRNFSRGHGDDKKYQHLPIQIAQVAGKGHKRQIGRIEHHFNWHKHDNCVAAGQNA